MTQQTNDQLLIEAVHQRDILMQAIHKTSIDIKLCDPDAAVTGPHLLMFCDDIVSIVNSQSERIVALERKLMEMGVQLSDE